MPVKSINSLEEFRATLAGDRPFVVDFWAPWCGPCKVISPIFEKFSDIEGFHGIDFYKVDTDEQQTIAHEVGVRSMPTFTTFKGGNKVKEVLGANPTAIMGMLKELSESS